MRWLTLISRFATGAFLANGVPHFVQGVTGQFFPTPFASPAGVGMSAPLVNVLWGSANFIVAYVLFAKTRPVPSRLSVDVGVLAVGFVATAASLAVVFSR